MLETKTFSKIVRIIIMKIKKKKKRKTRNEHKEAISRFDSCYSHRVKNLFYFIFKFIFKFIDLSITKELK